MKFRKSNAMKRKLLQSEKLQWAKKKKRTTFFHSFTEKCYEITSRLYFNLAHFQTNPRRYYREQNVSYITADLSDTANVLRRRYFLSNKCIEESLQVHVKAELCVSKATPRYTLDLSTNCVRLAQFVSYPTIALSYFPKGGDPLLCKENPKILQSSFVLSEISRLCKNYCCRRCLMEVCQIIF